MWFGTFTASRTVDLVFLLLWITFFLLATGEWTDTGLLHRSGGYTGLGTAIVALYLAAPGINKVHDRIVLPIGPYGPRAPSPLAGPGGTQSFANP
jgi:succinate-acetate transporter protein